MGRYYCRTHQREYNHNCPGCQADEAAEYRQRDAEDRERIIESLNELSEASAEQTEEIKQHLEDLEYKRFNPGDYECPECKYITLKRGASRCPTHCHASIPDSYWAEVYESERVAAERQAALEKAQAQQAAERARLKQEEEDRKAKSEVLGFLILMALCAVFGIIAFIHEKLSPQSSPPLQTAQSAVPKPPLTVPQAARVVPQVVSTVPPEQFVDYRACPYEGCRYGERWLVRKDIAVYSAPPTVVGMPTTSLQQATVLTAGTWVRTQTGQVLSRRREGRVQGFKGQRSYGYGTVNGPTLRDGDQISIYTYFGEGCWRTWITGSFWILCDLVPDGAPESEWWIQIATPNGTSAWTTKSSGALASQEELNYEVAMKISDTTLVLSDKLAQVDALLHEGADLNGNGVPLSGIDPWREALETKDRELIDALVARGLRIKDYPSCAAVSVEGCASR